jgi:hypothetical protein
MVGDKSYALYRECAGQVALTWEMKPDCRAHSRYNPLDEATLLWQDDCFMGDCIALSF